MPATCPATDRPGWVMRSLSRGAAFLGAALIAGSVWAGDLELLMFEQEGCIYCLRWHEEIGPAYPRTREGASAPLRRLDLRAPLPGDVTLTGRPPVFTPTFVLLRDGIETGRIEGYAGDEFFWFLLNGMLSRSGWTAEDARAGPDDAIQPGRIR